MDNRSSLHKVKPQQFENVAEGVKKRLETTVKRRQTCRLTIFDSDRNLANHSKADEIKLREEKFIQLEKWKEEKAKKKKEDAAKRKKPFIVGALRPAPKLEQVPKILPSTSSGVSRSQTKKATHTASTFVPDNASFCAPLIKNIENLPVLFSPSNKQGRVTMISLKQGITEMNSNEDSIDKNNQVKEVKKKTSCKTNRRTWHIQNGSESSKPKAELAGKNRHTTTTTISTMSGIEEEYEVTTIKAIQNSESVSEEKLRSPQEFPMTTNKISQMTANSSIPCIIKCRGKDNARREMKKKIRESIIEEQKKNMDDFNFFHHKANLETKRLTEIADHWEKVMEQNILPEFVQEAIRTAVGQARLLMSHKFQQFVSLVKRYNPSDPSQPLVTTTDLQGSWEMVYNQVKKIDGQFQNLRELQSRGWASEQAPIAEKKRKAANAKTAKPAVTSRIKDTIAAARKAKRENAAVPPEGSKTSEAGFFTVMSPIRSPALETPNKPITLLKAALSNEAKKASASKSATSFAMVRASMIENNQDSDYDTMNLIQFTPVDLKAAPGRKSLKRFFFFSSDTSILDSSLDKEISGSQCLESEDLPNSELENQEVKKVSNEEEKQENADFLFQNLIQFTPVDLKAAPSRKSLKRFFFCSSDTSILDSSLDKEISGSQCLESEDLPNSELENQEVKKVSNEEEKQENADLEKLPLEKKNVKVKKMMRRNAVEVFRPVKTRSQRKTVTPKEEVLQEINKNTTRRST